MNFTQNSLNNFYNQIILYAPQFSSIVCAAFCLCNQRYCDIAFSFLTDAFMHCMKIK